MSLAKRILTRSGETKDLFVYLWKAKMWFLIPFIIVLLFFAAIMIFANATGTAPFIYTLI